MSNGWPFSIPNDEQMSNKVGGLSRLSTNQENTLPGSISDQTNWLVFGMIPWIQWVVVSNIFFLIFTPDPWKKWSNFDLRIFLNRLKPPTRSRIQKETMTEIRNRKFCCLKDLLGIHLISFVMNIRRLSPKLGSPLQKYTTILSKVLQYFL